MKVYNTVDLELFDERTSRKTINRVNDPNWEATDIVAYSQNSRLMCDAISNNYCQSIHRTRNSCNLAGNHKNDVHLC
jgi:hypothetical protein